MINWNEITDGEMRGHIINLLKQNLQEYEQQALMRDQRSAKASSLRERRNAENCANYLRRQAAHFQQAIDLPTAAPMPCHGGSEDE